MTLLRSSIGLDPFRNVARSKGKFRSASEVAFVEPVCPNSIGYATYLPCQGGCFGLRTGFGRALISDSECPVFAIKFGQFRLDFIPFPSFESFLFFSF